MKKILFSALFLFAWVSGYPQKLVKVWETPQVFQTPESVLYDENNDVIYVSNMNGSEQGKDGNGFISKMTTAGKVKNLKWATGLNNPTGMGIFGNTLFVADIDQLVTIDLQNGTVIQKYDAPGTVFLNDITVRINGQVFVSDSKTGQIFLLDKGVLSIWLDDNKIMGTNGLLAEQGKLLVGGNSVYEVDIATKESVTLVENTGGIDGIDRDKKGRIIYSNWAGRIFILNEGSPVQLIDTSDKNINSADIDYAFKPDLVLVPTFFDNRVVAYRIED